MRFCLKEDGRTGEERGAFDFHFPPESFYISCYASNDGEELYLKSRNDRTNDFESKTYSVLQMTSDGLVRFDEVKDKSAISQDLLLRLNDKEELFEVRSPLSSKPDYVGFYEEFDRMRKYETYVEYLRYRRSNFWRRCSKKHPSQPIRCDAMRSVVGHRTLIWAFPDSSRLFTPSKIPSFFIDYKSLSDYRLTLFANCLYIYDHNTKTHSMGLIPTQFLEITSALRVRGTSEFLYRMAEFHTHRNDRVFFIGSVDHAYENLRLTVLLSFDIERKSILTIKNFGKNGVITDFEVNIDSPPVVDLNSNCAVALSSRKPEILVICLTTFSRITIDLITWTTKDFLDRWHRDKRRICMVFLSNYTKLLLFPKYSRDDYHKESLASGNVMPTSTIVNWGLLKATFFVKLSLLKETE